MNATIVRTGHGLTDLPNISFALAEELARVGIRSPEELAEAGAESAWVRLRSARLHHEPYTLLALEGAILGVVWQQLPASRRVELRQFASK